LQEGHEEVKGIGDVTRRRSHSFNEWKGGWVKGGEIKKGVEGESGGEKKKEKKKKKEKGEKEKEERRKKKERPRSHLGPSVTVK